MTFPTDPRIVARLVEFFEQTSDLVGVSDESGNVLYINPAVRKRLGVDVDTELTTADFFPPDAFAQYYDEIRPRLLSAGTWNGLLPIVNESGGSSLTFASVVADVGAGGEILGIVTYARELSHIAPSPLRTAPDVESPRVSDGLLELGAVAGDATRGPDPDQDLVALVFLNVTGIDEIDAVHGSDTGDVVLRALENRMLRLARVYDRVARIERNQYAILFRGIGDTAHGLRTAHLVRDLLIDSPVPSIDGDIEVSIDVGVAISGTDAELPDLLRRAEAVRLATRARNDSASEAVAEAIDSTTLSIGDLRVAQSQGLVLPYVQPVHDLRSGAVIGYQGLARWHHPTHGLLEPEAFIGVMSESSVAPVIDLKVARATSEAVTLTSRDTALRVYTPVSTRMLGDVRAEQHLREIVEAFSLAADRLYVQLSCRLLDPRSATLASMLVSMRDSGLRVVLTDVESASDVLAFADCEFAELHFSRQLTRASADGAQHDSVFEAIHYARELGRTVGAAGIETVVERDVLVDMGCDVGSGVLFGSPVPADSVE